MIIGAIIQSSISVSMETQLLRAIAYGVFKTLMLDSQLQKKFVLFVSKRVL